MKFSWKMNKLWVWVWITNIIVYWFTAVFHSIGLTNAAFWVKFMILRSFKFRSEIIFFRNYSLSQFLIESVIIGWMKICIQNINFRLHWQVKLLNWVALNSFWKIHYFETKKGIRTLKLTFHVSKLNVLLFSSTMASIWVSIFNYISNLKWKKNGNIHRNVRISSSYDRTFIYFVKWWCKIYALLRILRSSKHISNFPKKWSFVISVLYSLVLIQYYWKTVNWCHADKAVDSC